VRVGNNAYELVALVLDDKLNAGLKHAGHRHLDCDIAMPGARHGLVDAGNEHFVGAGRVLQAWDALEGASFQNYADRLSIQGGRDLAWGRRTGRGRML
jgi:hypothetical protein